jgi:hypothetical protein
LRTSPSSRILTRSASKKTSGYIGSRGRFCHSATGLNFIMEATEAHRKALFDLVQNAGIPVKS